jgi:hypothetical protein
MKIFLKLIAIAIITTTLITFPVGKQDVSLTATDVKSQSVKQQNQILKIALPFQARIIFKDTTSTKGKITNIDGNSKQMTLNKKDNYAITEIKTVTFEEKSEFKLIHSGVIRFRGSGSQSSSDNQERWIEPINHLKILNADDGLAQINLISVKPSKWRGIRQVAAHSSYVVDEIVFDDSASQVTITAIPHSE